jgi:hypothetical protein
MNPPMWTDEELLRALRAALREPVAGEGFIRAARAAFAWRTPPRPGFAGRRPGNTSVDRCRHRAAGMRRGPEDVLVAPTAEIAGRA